MNLQSLNTLEYEIIKTELGRHAVSYVGKSCRRAYANDLLADDSKSNGGNFRS